MNDTFPVPSSSSSNTDSSVSSTAATPTKFDIKELECILYDLFAILKSDTSKHSANIIAPKAVIYARLDRMKEIITSYKEPFKSCSECPLMRMKTTIQYEHLNSAHSCSDCPLWNDAENMRVAESTIDRICSWLSKPLNHDSLITYDEAENLREVLHKYCPSQRIGG